MDDDLWGPPSGPVVQDDTRYTQTVRGCEFYFDYRLDVIEENALNERSCVQVLRILIKNEDAEIDELERVLVLLQNDLAWAEHDNWPDICCNVVREKIDLLAEYLRTLKKGDEEDSEIQSLLHKGPIERLQNTLKALLENYCQAKDKLEQIHDAIPSDANVGSTQSALEEDANTCNVSVAEIIQNRDPRATGDRDPDAGLKLQETKANDPETVQHAATEVSSADASKEPFTNNGRISAGSESTIKSEEVGEHSRLSVATNKVLDSGKHADTKELLKPRTTPAEDSATNVNRDNVRPLNEIQKSRKSNFSSVRKSGEHQHSAADTSKSLSPLRQGKCGSPFLRRLVSKAKQKLREKRYDPAEKMESFSLAAKEDEARRKDDHQIVGCQDILTATEPFTMECLLEMCDEQDEGRETPHSKKAKISQPEVGHVAGSTAVSDVELLLAPARQKPESNAELNITRMQNTGSITTKKRLQNSSYNNMGPVKSFDRSAKQKITPNKQGDAGQISTDPGDSQRPTKKTKKSSIREKFQQISGSPVPIEDPDPPCDWRKSESESDMEILSDSEISTSDLKEMKANDLRAIAKALKVTHYYKLKKDDLVEQLTNRLSPRQPCNLTIQSGSYSVSLFSQKYGKSPAELKLRHSPPQESKV